VNRPVLGSRLSTAHFLLALAVVAVWGTNFVVIRLGLNHLPPLLFAALRFIFAVVPGIFFLRRPAVPWSELAAYGVMIGAGQFGVLYVAMNGHISPGLASLVVQMQVFFTIGLAMWSGNERLERFQWVALALAVAGIAVIAAHAGGGTTVLGVTLVLFAALAWAGGNIIARRSGKVNMLAYVVWASLFSAPPLLALSWIFEGGPAMLEGVRHADFATWCTILWQSVGNTLFGYAAWAWLLARHPAATISPMALLVPVFGMGASAIWLGEPLPMWKVLAAAAVMAGLLINFAWPALTRRRRIEVMQPPAA
jgi:O-acetylserine/cysteine efflux transporter